MRVALLLRGAIAKKKSRYSIGEKVVGNDYVKYSSCQKSIQQHIIEPNINKHEIDTYLCSWNYDLEKELIDLYKPKHSLFLDNSVYTNDIINILNTHNLQDKHYSFATLSQSLNIKFGIELIEKADIFYDLIIIYRLDTLLWKNMIFDDFNTDYIYCNGHHDTKVGDFHFVMNLENAKEFKLAFRNAENGLRPEAHHFFRNNIYNYMNKPLYEDSTTAGQDHEILRGVYENCYKKGFITEEQLQNYELTVEEIQSYSV